MISVIAIGNGGCNIADSISKQCCSLGDARFIFCDTDGDSLHKHGNAGDEFIVLNQDDACFPDVIPAGTNSVIIIVTLGGKTGCKFAPLAAAQAKKVSVENVIAIATTPFAFEGEDKCAKALKTTAELSDICDKTIIQDNETLLSTCSELNLLTAFECADKAMTEAIEKLNI